jgi:CRISPR/Cas system CSM-associated protein Csm3 (group 7 of RAMP superfamily)
MKSRTERYPLRYLARVVIEFKTSFLIGAGRDDCFADDVFVSDANGLPAIPGSSIAGVLRRQLDKEQADKIFGKQDEDDSEGSRLTISWGCIHDSNNKPVEGLIPPSALSGDPVLRQAVFSMVRDHVCINHRGVADQGGKFDERCVDAGHRFTFELMLEGDGNDKNDWDKLLSAFGSNTLRLGGKTRRGYGAFEVTSLKTETFDLFKLKECETFCAHTVELRKNSPMQDQLDSYAKDSTKSNAIALKVDLTPEGFWMIGGGDGDDADMTPVEASRIIWDDANKGSVIKDILVPGTAIKGPLSHRVAYYYNALSGAFADREDAPEPVVGPLNKAVQCLFGYAKNDKKKQDGQAGRVFIDDIYISASASQKKIINHVSIDRFTGGAKTKSGALFSESPIYKGNAIKLNITIVDTDKIQKEVNIKEAFTLALQDLTEGQLAIGSGDGRGNGYFTSAEAINLQW